MRYPALLVTLIALAYIFVVFPPTLDLSMFVVVVAVSVAVLALALVTRPAIVDTLDGAPHGPPADERRLHGSFRRQTHPHTPGRPMPRAPGNPAGSFTGC